MRIFAFWLAVTSGVAAAAPSPEQIAADFVCSIEHEQPDFDYPAHFGPDFVAAIPLDSLKTLLTGVAQTFGPCVNATPAALTTSSSAVVAMRLRTGDDGKIIGFAVTSADDPRIVLRSWADVTAALDKLPGATSAYLTPALSTRAETPLAIGSTFKLWVLGALYDQVRAPADATWHWSSPRVVRNEWKSLPSGQVQDYPGGTTVSLYELARKMISESDNTATDLLVHSLGRDAVARMAPAMGRTNSHPGNNPLIMTSELFKLKWLKENPPAVDYIAADVAGRRAILGTLATVSLDDVCVTPDCFATPRHIDTIEWFATTQETCAAMDWLATTGDVNIADILSVNVPFVTVGGASHWVWAGFKGGSEPGVFHLTLGLQSKAGNRGCLSFGLNDPNGSGSAYATVGRDLQIEGLMTKMAAFAETVIP